jgi:LPXTG-site transpeptidase (sortase) family protein
MNKIKPRVSFVIAVITATLPLYFLVQGMVNLLRPQIAESVTQPSPETLPYKVVKCSEEKKSSTATEFVPEHINIAGAGVDLKVVSVPLEAGTWKVNNSVANYAQGTSLVSNKEGNVGIFAHDRQVGFANIKNLKDQDSIEVFGNGYKAVYKVNKQDVVDPTSVDVFYKTEEPTLTLVTCTGLFSQKRYIIRATLEHIEETNCNEETN